MDRSRILPAQLSLNQAINSNSYDLIRLSDDAIDALEKKNMYTQLVQYGSGCISWLSAAMTINQIIRIPIHTLGLVASLCMYGLFAKSYFLLKTKLVDSQLEILKKNHCQSIFETFVIFVSHVVTFSLAFMRISEKTLEKLQIIEAIAAGLCVVGFIFNRCQKV